MLKFSGYPYLIRGQPEKDDGLSAGAGRAYRAGDKAPYARGPDSVPPLPFGPVPRRGGQGPTHKPGLRAAMTLGQACPPEYQGAQCAFKDSMIH
ncbi:hypothetical protein N7520_000010 [Penicillium odoratum]|jgi:hypothetical protein|nr:hypothetical protein N7520_000004 [Penicillium odoratum]KAJ5776764.1 hypothetical protein N7520_000010 [Penicillium odoratum]